MSELSDRNRRVVITGVGVICPLGSSSEELDAALQAGQSGVVKSDCPAMPFAAEAQQFTGGIDGFGDVEGPQKKAIRKALKVMCRETQMAVASAGLALMNSRIAEGSLDPERAGVVLGSDYMLTMPEDYVDGINRCTGEAGEFEFEGWGNTGLGEMTPLWMLKYLPNMPASHIAILHDLRGPNNSLTLREAASNMAVGEAYRTVARGHADVMLAGATGTRILPMQAIHAIQTEQLATGDVAPESASRPFDKNRLGMVPGEGSGVVVLEELEAAKARGAEIYGEVLGLGSALVADRELRGNCRAAMAGAIRQALADANVEPAQIGHINAHGIATPERDADEAAALHDVLGDAAKTIPVVALKSNFGNLGAGSGVVELIGSLLAMKSGKLPKVLNWETPDPDCNLTIASGSEDPGEVFLKLSVTPQGQASALVVRRI